MPCPRDRRFPLGVVHVERMLRTGRERDRRDQRQSPTATNDAQ